MMQKRAARKDALRRAMTQKTVRVLVRCYYVDNDGSPLDLNGDSPDGSKGWKQAWEWAPRSRSFQWLTKYPKGWRPIVKRRAK